MVTTGPSPRPEWHIRVVLDSTLLGKGSTLMGHFWEDLHCPKDLARNSSTLMGQGSYPCCKFDKRLDAAHSKHWLKFAFQGIIRICGCNRVNKPFWCLWFCKIQPLWCPHHPFFSFSRKIKTFLCHVRSWENFSINSKSLRFNSFVACLNHWYIDRVPYFHQ